MLLKLLALVPLQPHGATAQTARMAQTQCERESCEQEGSFMQVRAVSESPESAESAMDVDSHLAFLQTWKDGKDGAHLPASLERLKTNMRGMALRALQEPNTNLTKFNSSQFDVTVMYQTIIDQMEVVINGTLDSQERDTRELADFKGHVEQCNSNLATKVNNNAPDSVTAFSPSVQTSSEEHDTCRNQQVETQKNLTDANSTFEGYMATPYSNNGLQGCLRGFVSECANDNKAPYSEREQFATAISCAELIDTWAGPFSTEAATLQQAFTTAKQIHENKTAECNGLQKDFEDAFCTYRTNLLAACGDLTDCYDNAVRNFQEIKDLVLESNTSRHVAFIAARQVQCYIRILMTDNLTFSALDECDHNAVDTSVLNLTIPELPSKSDCDTSFVDPYPCQDAWINSNYENKSWYKDSNISFDVCSPCPVQASPTTTPVPPVSTIAGGTFAVCALTNASTQGNLRCAGGGDAPQDAALGGLLGEGEDFVDVDLGTNRTATSVAGFFVNFCATMDNGQAKCWGRNFEGQLGSGLPASSTTSFIGDAEGEMGDALPAVIVGADEVVMKMLVGLDHTCAILQSGNVKCFGASGNGALGYTTTDTKVGDDPQDTILPVPLGDGSAIDGDAGERFTCIVLQNASCACWGLNANGRLGRGESVANAGPKVIDLGGVGVSQVRLGRDHACALQDGTVTCWGSNSVLQLGLPASVSQVGFEAGDMGENLTAVDLGGRATHIAAGRDHTCAILNDTSVTCWGNNAFGQVLPGQGGGEAPPTPVVYNGSPVTNVVELALPYAGTCVRFENQTILCWGDSLTNRLGAKVAELNPQ